MMTQNSANLAGNMIVVYVPTMLRCRRLSSAYGASTTLSFQQLATLLKGYSVGPLQVRIKAGTLIALSISHVPSFLVGVPACLVSLSPTPHVLVTAYSTTCSTTFMRDARLGHQVPAVA